MYTNFTVNLEDRMTTPDYFPLPIEPEPPTKRPRSHQSGRMNWRQAWEDLNDMAESTVYGWVKLQTKVPDSARIRRWEIVQRLDVSSNLLDIRYEAGTVGSRWWNRPEENEIHGDRVWRKMRQQKKQLAEKWGWDTWVRWTPPEQLTDEQVARVAKIDADQSRWRAEADAVTARNAERHEFISSMDSWAREIYHLEDGVEHLPPHLRERDERRATLLKRVRLIAHRKNQRMGQDGWREWRISITRDMAERGKR
ncbi:hypothetical protein SEA_DEJAVU_116 [Microbacterium Phage DejaVu]|nr:hypothetical protein SEA_ROMAN_116 [Microbacterium phage Roman]WNM66248.1 hypothetical protein SEA_DEJAVU_116 [Microbacterium Phage DejaVu]